jgi:hypothetical protein
LKKKSPKNILIKIIRDSDKYNSLNPNKKAEWWKDVINRMKKEIGTAKTKEILKICGSKCCGQGHRKTGRKKFKESKSIEEFLYKHKRSYL